MSDTTNENTKVCPLCKKGYPETINYCREDGTRLQASADEIPFPNPHVNRTTAGLEMSPIGV